MSLYNFINLIRYKSYLKNLIIFLPLFLNYTSWSIANFGKIVLPVIFFSFLASSIYIINDLNDLETDKKHKSKKLRPLASGLIQSKTAIFRDIRCLCDQIECTAFCSNIDAKLALLELNQHVFVEVA